MSLRLKSLFSVGMLAVICLMLPNPARADDFTFTFTNGTDTVNGRINGLTDGTTSTPTSVYITSIVPTADQDAFVALVPTLLTFNFVVGAPDSFAEAGGVITGASFEGYLTGPPDVALIFCNNYASTDNSGICANFIHQNSFAELEIFSEPEHDTETLTGAVFTSVATTPEPSSLCLMLIALVALGTSANYFKGGTEVDHRGDAKGDS